MILNKYLIFFTMFIASALKISSISEESANKNKYTIVVYVSQTDSLSKLLLQLVSKYVDTKNATNIGIDMMCSVINDQSKAGVICCVKNGVILFEEKVSAASVVTIKKCKDKFDTIFELNQVPQNTRSIHNISELNNILPVDLETTAISNNSRKE